MPRLFKGKLARFAPQFSGYNQHDSQVCLHTYQNFITFCKLLKQNGGVCFCLDIKERSFFI